MARDSSERQRVAGPFPALAIAGNRTSRRDCNCECSKVFAVCIEPAGGWLAPVRLKINEAKSAVVSVFGRKFLGYSLWVAAGGVVKRNLAVKPLATFKQRVRELTRRGGRNLLQVVEKLRPYLLGWKGYFRLAQTPGVMRELDKWVRSPARDPVKTLEARNDHVP